jgi:acetyl-CoA acetyltransferase|nr:acetyl-CoA acetyltransferase [Pseudooceanicola nanhaiensis]
MMETGDFPRGKTAFVGHATHGMGEAHGYSSMDLMVISALKALDCAGLTPGDVDAVFTGHPNDYLNQMTFIQQLGINPRYMDNNRTGGSAFLVHAFAAAHLLASGAIDVALIAYGSNQRTEGGKLIQSIKPSPYVGPFRPMIPLSAYALAASRHMHEYGTTAEQQAEVAVAARKWANLNPDAFMHGQNLSIEDCLAARPISTPLRKTDCCLVTDGGAAVVIVRADRARDLADRPAYLLGAGQCVTHNEIYMMPDMTVTGAKWPGKRAFAAAGLGPSDVDVVELYDAFTINTILFLEDLGFCAKGEGGAFVSDGQIAPGGALPVNTDGGGLSCVHPGMYGLFTMVEAIT